MRQSHKTLLLWLLLVAMMVVIWALVGGDGSAPMEASPDASPDDDGQVWWVLGASVLLVGGLVGYGRWAQRGRPDNERGVELLSRGRHAEALAAFEAARATRDLAIYRMNAAIARLMLFQIDEALSTFEQNERTGATPHVKAAAAQYGAMARALAGRTTDADRTLVTSKEHPYYILIRAVVAARRGAFTEAGEILESGEIRQLGGKERAIADTLAAWCALETRGERHPIDRTALFGEAAPDGLFAVWPELEAFLERHEDQRSSGG